MKLWFNEGDAKNYEKLQANIAAVPGITTLAHRPRITSSLISEEFSPKLSGMRTPSFIFADPCGYKGLSLHLIASALKPFGNDCVFLCLPIQLQPREHETRLILLTLPSKQPERSASAQQSVRYATLRSGNKSSWAPWRTP